MNTSTISLDDSFDHEVNLQPASNFYSTTKFINYLNSKFKDNNFTKAICYFEGKDTFKNRFNKCCCKPLFITLESKNKKDYKHIKFSKIEELFGDSIIISFNCKFAKEDRMFVLVIEFKQKVYLDTPYNTAYVLNVSNEHNIKFIRDQFKIEYDESNLLDED